MKQKEKKGRSMSKCMNPGGGAVYGIGLIGALVYFIQQATTVAEGLLGVVKAILWPAFFVHKLFGFLGM
jgi:hypothetical protein